MKDFFKWFVILMLAGMAIGGTFAILFTRQAIQLVETIK